jgi:hypothetical protein
MKASRMKPLNSYGGRRREGSQLILQRECFGYDSEKTYSAQLENLTALDGQG